MGALTLFFLKNGFHSKRFLWMGLLGLFPLVCTLILWLFQPVLARENITLAQLYPQLSYYLYLHFLLPLMAVFMGTGVIEDEVEERTLPYLLVRPVPRAAIVLSKALAGMVILGAVLCVSLGLTYLITGLNGEPAGFRTWAGSAGVLLLGVAAYMSLFTFTGGVFRRPVLIGLLFTFGWESTVIYAPGKLKLFTIMHYLQVLFPGTRPVQSPDLKTLLLNLFVPQETTSDLNAWAVLLGTVLVFLAAGSMLLYVKEYRLNQE